MLLKDLLYLLELHLCLGGLVVLRELPHHLCLVDLAVLQDMPHHLCLVDLEVLLVRHHCQVAHEVHQEDPLLCLVDCRQDLEGSLLFLQDLLQDQLQILPNLPEPLHALKASLHAQTASLHAQPESATVLLCQKDFRLDLQDFHLDL